MGGCERANKKIQFGSRLKIKMSGTACEIGCGDCLASADLLLGGGYKKIYLIEKNMSHKIHEKQQNILKYFIIFIKSKVNKCPNVVTASNAIDACKSQPSNNKPSNLILIINVPITK